MPAANDNEFNGFIAVLENVSDWYKGDGAVANVEATLDACRTAQLNHVNAMQRISLEGSGNLLRDC